MAVFSSFWLLLLCVAVARGNQTLQDVATLNSSLSQTAAQKLQQVFEIMKQRNWKDALMRQIGEHKRNSTAEERLELRMERQLEKAVQLLTAEIRDSQPEPAPARRPGKLNKQVLLENKDELDDGYGLQRAKRSNSEPETVHEHQPLQPTQSATDRSTLATHLQSTRAETSTVSQEEDDGSQPCSSEYQFHCIYGVCREYIDWGIVYCSCYDGYGGPQCEQLQINVALADLAFIAGSDDPQLAALNDPKAFSAATAVAHYLAGELEL